MRSFSWIGNKVTSVIDFPSADTKGWRPWTSPLSAQGPTDLRSLSAGSKLVNLREHFKWGSQYLRKASQLELTLLKLGMADWFRYIRIIFWSEGTRRSISATQYPQQYPNIRNSIFSTQFLIRFLWNCLREFVQPSVYFMFGDHLIHSHDLFV